MGRKLSILDQVRVASPCTVSWAAMKGDDRVRFCGECKLNVYNLSDMSRDDAEALLKSHHGRLCVRYYQRRDGTILTADCPVGLWQLRRRFLKVLGGVATGFACIIGGLHALARGSHPDAEHEFRLAYVEPILNAIAWIENHLLPPPPRVVMGELVGLPPPPPPPPARQTN